MDELSAGLVVYRASRLEALLDPLAHLLETQLPADVLAPQTVIAAHPGMRHWLAGSLARRRGAGGVVANLDIVLPSAWLDRLAHEVLGARAVSVEAYRREHLRWRIFSLLDGSDIESLASYLQGSDAARRRFQLADRLARLYVQYMVYRPDWLQAWANKERPPRDRSLDAGFLAPLWRRLRRQIDAAHRGEVLAQLREALIEGARIPAASEPLHVFGLSHLPPLELDLLRTVARQRLVVLYVPDPCRERWAGLQNDRQILREKVRADAFGADAESLFLEQEHPLLAQWGRLGQHFVLALEDGQDAVRLDVRHWQDEAEADVPPPETLLGRVQESVRRLLPALMSPVGDDASQRRDASLRVHVCHTRLRELEVLRDALLRHLRDDPTLRPSDIVVMAPDIASYLPLLPAVFGVPGRFEGPLPYHLADVAVARSHPLFEAFRRLLDLPRARLTAPEVLDIAALPDVSRRFGFSPADLDLLAQWLSNARVAWALDARFRERLGVPALDAHTFAWGVDRMIAGYLVGPPAEHGATLALPDGTELAPLDGVHGPQAAALGGLDALLVELAEAHGDGQRRLRASHWAQRLEARLDGLLRVDPDDGHARDARALLLRFIREIATEPAQAGMDPELDFDVVRELLLERLDTAPDRQQFLMGGATFCGMVPQRAIPFGVIAVIGLNEGEFPRGGENGLDLMQRHRRLGDRDVRSDDRYLFLETLMSARVALHLSYVGENVRDGRPRNPAAPLAELMGALDAAHGVSDDAPDSARPWQVRHPLQPFDARYFDGNDPALYSFRREFARMVTATPVASRPFFGSVPAETAEAAPTGDGVPLRELLDYYRDPARQLLAGGLRLRLDALQPQRLAASEPLEARFERIDGVAGQLLAQALDTGVLPENPPAWLRLTGLLPPGHAGQAAWHEELAQTAKLLERCRAHRLFANGMPPRYPLQVDQRIDGLRVRGELRHCHAGDDADWIVQVLPGRREESLDFKARIGLFVEWALLRLQLDDAQRGARLCIVCEEGPRRWETSINEWDEVFVLAARAGDAGTCDVRRADLRARVAALLHFWLRAQHAPAWYFPRTSWAAVNGKPAADAWRGGSHTLGERDYAPGYARVLAGDCEFEDGTPEHESLVQHAKHLHELIEFQSEVQPA